MRSAARHVPSRRRFVLATIQLTLALGAFATTGAQISSSAWANAPVLAFSMTPSTTQAGEHPDIDTIFHLGSRYSEGAHPSDAKNIEIHAPQGVIADPHAYPYCTQAEFGSDICPIDTQVGASETGFGFLPSPVYNLEPNPGQAGLLAFTAPLLNFPIFLIVHPRTASDYGLDLTVLGLQHILPVEFLEFTLWGVPAESSHDAERVGPAGCDISGTGSPECKASNPSNVPAAPFLDAPTTCSGALEASIDVSAYDNGTSHGASTYPGTTGCDQLSFNPSLSAQPTTEQADSASGLAVNLSVPQLESPTVPSPSEIRATTVTLPEGFSINPNAADGKTSCSDTEAQIGTENEAECPEFSKVGSLSLDSSALPGPLPGYIYIGAPLPGERYRLILTGDGFGIHVKLVGTVEPNPQTGQLVISFQNLPQTPFQDFNMHFFGSERGLLATPTRCGTFAVNSTFTPWDTSLPDQSSSQFFRIVSGPDGTACPGSSRPFSPQFAASAVRNEAGGHAPFVLRLTRNDGDQNLASLSVTTPPGLLATLRGIPYCPDAALAAAAAPSYSGLAEQQSPSCPAASQIGTVTVGAGAGTHPVYLPGKVYLAGSYKGAPLSLAVITPAVSGPYDLGNVVVRAALEVNPTTTQITAVSDPLPQILQGIPLRLRSILIDLNRQNFTLNPTNCAPLSVNAQVGGAEGGSASFSEHFQVANCATLPFAPKLALKLSGGVKRNTNPALQATLTSNEGAANLATTSVALPHSLLIDNAHIKNPCTKPQFAAHNCPPGSVLGFAKAETPLLEKPLEGPVYLATGYGHKLPDLVAELNGQIHVVLDARIDTDKQEGLRTSFESIPDAPVSKFTLSLKGGKSGLLVNSANLCKAKQIAIVKFGAQNSKSANANATIQTSCQVKAKRQKRSRRHYHAHGSRAVG